MRKQPSRKFTWRKPQDIKSQISQQASPTYMACTRVPRLSTLGSPWEPKSTLEQLGLKVGPSSRSEVQTLWWITPAVKKTRYPSNIKQSNNQIAWFTAFLLSLLNAEGGVFFWFLSARCFTIKVISESSCLPSGGANITSEGSPHTARHIFGHIVATSRFGRQMLIYTVYIYTCIYVYISKHICRYTY